MLRQQRGKYEDRIVAARPGFRIVDLRQKAAASLLNSALRSLLSRAGSLNGAIVLQRGPDGFFQRQLTLSPGRRRKEHDETGQRHGKLRYLTHSGANGATLGLA